MKNAYKHRKSQHKTRRNKNKVRYANNQGGWGAKLRNWSKKLGVRGVKGDNAKHYHDGIEFAYKENITDKDGKQWGSGYFSFIPNVGYESEESYLARKSHKGDTASQEQPQEPPKTEKQRLYEEAFQEYTEAVKSGDEEKISKAFQKARDALDYEDEELFAVETVDGKWKAKSEEPTKEQAERMKELHDDIARQWARLIERVGYQLLIGYNKKAKQTLEKAGRRYLRICKEAYKNWGDGEAFKILDSTGGYDVLANEGAVAFRKYLENALTKILRSKNPQELVDFAKKRLSVPLKDGKNVFKDKVKKEPLNIRVEGQNQYGDSMMVDMPEYNYDDVLSNNSTPDDEEGAEGDQESVAMGISEDAFNDDYQPDVTDDWEDDYDGYVPPMEKSVPMGDETLDKDKEKAKEFIVAELENCLIYADPKLALKELKDLVDKYGAYEEGLRNSYNAFLEDENYASIIERLSRIDKENQILYEEYRNDKSPFGMGKSSGVEKEKQLDKEYKNAKQELRELIRVSFRDYYKSLTEPSAPLDEDETFGMSFTPSRFSDDEEDEEEILPNVQENAQTDDPIANVEDSVQSIGEEAPSPNKEEEVGEEQDSDKNNAERADTEDDDPPAKESLKQTQKKYPTLQKGADFLAENLPFLNKSLDERFALDNSWLHIYKEYKENPVSYVLIQKDYDSRSMSAWEALVETTTDRLQRILGVTEEKAREIACEYYSNGSQKELKATDHLPKDTVSLIKEFVSQKAKELKFDKEKLLETQEWLAFSFCYNVNARYRGEEEAVKSFLEWAYYDFKYKNIAKHGRNKNVFRQKRKGSKFNLTATLIEIEKRLRQEEGDKSNIENTTNELSNDGQVLEQENASPEEVAQSIAEETGAEETVADKEPSAVEGTVETVEPSPSVEESQAEEVASTIGDAQETNTADTEEESEPTEGSLGFGGVKGFFSDVKKEDEQAVFDRAEQLSQDRARKEEEEREKIAQNIWSEMQQGSANGEKEVKVNEREEVVARKLTDEIQTIISDIDTAGLSQNVKFALEDFSYLVNNEEDLETVTDSISNLALVLRDYGEQELSDKISDTSAKFLDGYNVSKEDDEDDEDDEEKLGDESAFYNGLLKTPQIKGKAFTYKPISEDKKQRLVKSAFDWTVKEFNALDSYECFMELAEHSIDDVLVLEERKREKEREDTDGEYEGGVFRNRELRAQIIKDAITAYFEYYGELNWHRSELEHQLHTPPKKIYRIDNQGTIFFTRSDLETMYNDGVLMLDSSEGFHYFENVIKRVHEHQAEQTASEVGEEANNPPREKSEVFNNAIETLKQLDTLSKTSRFATEIATKIENTKEKEELADAIKKRREEISSQNLSEKEEDERNFSPEFIKELEKLRKRFVKANNEYKKKTGSELPYSAYAKKGAFLQDIYNMIPWSLWGDKDVQNLYLEIAKTHLFADPETSEQKEEKEKQNDAQYKFFKKIGKDDLASKYADCPTARAEAKESKQEPNSEETAQSIGEVAQAEEEPKQDIEASVNETPTDKTEELPKESADATADAPKETESTISDPTARKLSENSPFRVALGKATEWRESDNGSSKERRAKYTAYLAKDKDVVKASEKAKQAQEKYDEFVSAHRERKSDDEKKEYRRLSANQTRTFNALEKLIRERIKGFWESNNNAPTDAEAVAQAVGDGVEPSAVQGAVETVEPSPSVEESQAEEVASSIGSNVSDNEQTSRVPIDESLTTTTRKQKQRAKRAKPTEHSQDEYNEEVAMGIWGDIRKGIRKNPKKTSYSPQEIAEILRNSTIEEIETIKEDSSLSQNVLNIFDDYNRYHSPNYKEAKNPTIGEYEHIKETLNLLRDYGEFAIADRIEEVCRKQLLKMSVASWSANEFENYRGTKTDKGYMLPFNINDVSNYTGVPRYVEKQKPTESWAHIREARREEEEKEKERAYTEEAKRHIVNSAVYKLVTQQGKRGLPEITKSSFLTDYLPKDAVSSVGKNEEWLSNDSVRKTVIRDCLSRYLQTHKEPFYELKVYDSKDGMGTTFTFDLDKTGEALAVGFREIQAENPNYLQDVIKQAQSLIAGGSDDITQEWTFSGYNEYDHVREYNKEMPSGRVKVDWQTGDVSIKFDRKPDYDVRNKLKKNGYRWDSQNYVWRKNGKDRNDDYGFGLAHYIEEEMFRLNTEPDKNLQEEWTQQIRARGNPTASDDTPNETDAESTAMSIANSPSTQEPSASVAQTETEHDYVNDAKSYLDGGEHSQLLRNTAISAWSIATDDTSYNFKQWGKHDPVLCKAFVEFMRDAKTREKDANVPKHLLVGDLFENLKKIAQARYKQTLQEPHFDPSTPLDLNATGETDYVKTAKYYYTGDRYYSGLWREARKITGNEFIKVAKADPVICKAFVTYVDCEFNNGVNGPTYGIQEFLSVVKERYNQWKADPSSVGKGAQPQASPEKQESKPVSAKEPKQKESALTERQPKPKTPETAEQQPKAVKKFSKPLSERKKMELPSPPSIEILDLKDEQSIKEYRERYKAYVENAINEAEDILEQAIQERRVSGATKASVKKRIEESRELIKEGEYKRALGELFREHPRRSEDALVFSSYIEDKPVEEIDVQESKNTDVKTGLSGVEYIREHGIETDYDKRVKAVNKKNMHGAMRNNYGLYQTVAEQAGVTNIPSLETAEDSDTICEAFGKVLNAIYKHGDQSPQFEKAKAELKNATERGVAESKDKRFKETVEKAKSFLARGVCPEKVSTMEEAGRFIVNQFNLPREDPPVNNYYFLTLRKTDADDLKEGGQELEDLYTETTNSYIELVKAYASGDQKKIKEAESKFESLGSKLKSVKNKVRNAKWQNEQKEKLEDFKNVITGSFQDNVPEERRNVIEKLYKHVLETNYAKYFYTDSGADFTVFSQTDEGKSLYNKIQKIKRAGESDSSYVFKNSIVGFCRENRIKNPIEYTSDDFSAESSVWRRAFNKATDGEEGYGYWSPSKEQESTDLSMQVAMDDRIRDAWTIAENAYATWYISDNSKDKAKATRERNKLSNLIKQRLEELDNPTQYSRPSVSVKYNRRRSDRLNRRKQIHYGEDYAEICAMRIGSVIN